MVRDQLLESFNLRPEKIVMEVLEHEEKTGLDEADISFPSFYHFYYFFLIPLCLQIIIKALSMLQTQECKFALQLGTCKQNSTQKKSTQLLCRDLTIQGQSQALLLVHHASQLQNSSDLTAVKSSRDCMFLS